MNTFYNFKFKEKDQRVVEYCLRQIAAGNYIATTTVSNAEEGCQIISEFINKKIELSLDKKKQYAQNMLEGAKRELLPFKDLNWIKDDKIACCWFWLSVAHVHQFAASPEHPFTTIIKDTYRLGYSPAKTPSPQLLTNNYRNLNLSLCLSNSQERFDEIIKFLDRSAQPLIWQKQLIEKLKGDWSYIANARRPFSWLSKDNDKQCRWALDYIHSYGKKQGLYDFLNTYSTKPVNTEERYLLIYAAFHCWETSKEPKLLFAKNFNSAWSQKKVRDNRQGKKTINLSIREDIKIKLDEMLENQGHKRDKFIEMLIEKEYSNTVESKE